MIVILIIFLLTSYAIGWAMVAKWNDRLPHLFLKVGAFLLGTMVSVSIAYLLASLFVRTGEPMLWGTLGAICVGLPFIKFMGIPGKKIPFTDYLLVACTVLFSMWIMVKTFHGNSAGEIFVGSNNIFDFGLAIGLMRSMSWGANIPVMSPFFSGLPLFYHFFFNFWTAMWEYFGVPLVWAINIPSMLSFSALLVVIYYIPQILAKQKPLVGWLAVLLTVTNSSLTFWKLLPEIKTLWRLPAYPFAGPFDGSTISIYMTLNNYVNQRHLAFALALGLFLSLLAVQKGSSFVIGIMTGLLFMWNMAVFALVIVLIAGYYAFSGNWKDMWSYLVSAGIIVCLFLLPYARYLYQSIVFFHVLTNTVGQQLPKWSVAEYFWQNLGLLPVIAAAGYFTLRKEAKRYMIPFIFLFISMCVLAAIGKRGFDQKLLSFVIVGVNILAAVALGSLWEKKNTFLKILALILLFVVTVSGFVDLMPIKNEFAYPFIGKDTIPLISWIHTSTQKNAVFVSYSDMIDPVVLAGRNNYFGFFGNIGQYDRSADVRQIYAGDIKLAMKDHISFILVPRWQKTDFPYQIDKGYLSKVYSLAYEDDKFLIFNVTK